VSSKLNSVWFATLVGVSAVMSYGCDAKVEAPKETTSEGSPATVADPDPPATVDPCEEKDDGASCGSDQHCIAGKCLHNICGDGVASGDEQCDDGLEALGDACSPACMLTPPSCGDGKRDANEECDDSNSVDDDACSTSCTLNVCGNGRRDAKEECDDGNAVDEDFCTRACKRSLCRNGRLDPGEECDDGNAVHNDGCTNDCRMAGCGDGKLISEGVLKEECDDGNRDDKDKCSNACTESRCGNRRIDPNEACDGNEGPMGSVCKSDCSGFESDPCDVCSKAKCSAFCGLEDCTGVDTLDFYVGCRMKAPEVTAGGLPPRAGFTEDCTAYDRCVLLNDCAKADYQEGSAVKCLCGALSITDCLSADMPAGPCAAEAIKAADCENAPSKGSCAAGANFSDYSRPSGYLNGLFQCRSMFCRAQCGL
jgi:cysteine-rich repeat protein